MVLVFLYLALVSGLILQILVYTEQQPCAFSLQQGNLGEAKDCYTEQLRVIDVVSEAEKDRVAGWQTSDLD